LVIEVKTVCMAIMQTKNISNEKNFFFQISCIAR